MKANMILGCLAWILVAMPAYAQWSDNTSAPIQISEKYTWGDEMLVDDEGNVYFYYLSPEGSMAGEEQKNVSPKSFRHYKNGIYGDGKSLRIVPYVKKINYNGTEAWASPLRLSAYPTKSYTMINGYITLDKQGNLLAVVWDERLDSVNGGYTATAYKISPEGQMLWGEEGVNLCEGKSLAFGACMNLTTLDDNSTVFAWAGMEKYEESARQAIYMQRVTADGKTQWTGKKIADDQAAITYPYMVNAGSNEYFMFYCSGATPDFYVQKYDFDGNAVWAQPTLVYGMGGFGNGGAMQTIVNVAPAKNGMLVGWNDDRNNTKQERTYIAYIDRDGKHVFSTGDAGLQVGYSDLRSFRPSMAYNYETDDIYVTWRETSSTQSYQQVRAQRVSPSGELMWDTEGVEICALEERQAGQESVQAGLKGGAIFFYMTQRAMGDFGHTVAYASLYSQEGQPVWDKDVALTDGQNSQASLVSLPLRKNQWVVSFHDNRNYDGNQNYYDVFSQNILIDGKLGSDAHLLANENGLEAVAAFGVYPNPVRESLNIRIETGHPATLRLTLCNLLGMEVASLYEGRVQGMEVLSLPRPAGVKAGAYVVKAILDGKESAVKVILQ